MSVAVITGAGSGVGRGLALALAQKGWNLGLIGHGQMALEQTAKLVADLGVQTSIQTIDVSDYAQVNGAAANIKQQLGTIDSWINAAAVGVFGPVAEAEPDDLDRTMAVNYNGVVHGSRVAAAMGAKSIVNIGSSLAFTTVPYNVAYAATKAAVRSFSLGLGLELHKQNITVCVAHLPAIATPWFVKARTLTPFQSRPVGGMHTPEAIGRAISELVEHPRFGDSYLGIDTWFVATAARAFPRIVGWFAREVGIRLQTTKQPAPTQTNLYEAIEPPPAAPKFRASDRTPKWWPRLGHQRVR